MPDDELVTIDRFIFLPDAEIARATLEASGIDAVLIGEHTTRMAWAEATAHGGVRLQVRRRDAETAREILREENVRSTDPTDEGAPRDITPLAPDGTCRRCGSEEVFPKTTKAKLFARALVFGFALMVLVNAATCAGAALGRNPPPDSVFAAIYLAAAMLPLFAVLSAAFFPLMQCRHCKAEWRGEQRTN